MSELTRRGFLRGMAILAAGSQFDYFSLSNKLIGRNDYSSFGKWRAVAQYDMFMDEMIVRYDILTNDGQQIGVDAECDDFSDVKKYRERIHKPMVEVLSNELKHRKIKPSDLITIPHPTGYTAPPGFEKLIRAI